VRILIVEDDKDLSEALDLGLRGRGHEVVVAPDGERGWQALQGPGDSGRPPEVILLDLLMPGMNGRHFRTRQLADARFATIPTIVITGQPVDPATRDSVGRAPILRKPLDLTHLLAAIEEVCQPGRRLKHCGCGRVYDADSWRELPWVCEMDNGRDVGERLELRQCACKSTLAWELGRHAVSIRVPVAQAGAAHGDARRDRGDPNK
jgi:DNA-binding response OmpR family regulator